MSRESSDNFVCGTCGETIYKDSCACDREDSTLLRDTLIFAAKLFFWFVVGVALVVGWLAL